MRLVLTPQEGMALGGGTDRPESVLPQDSPTPCSPHLLQDGSPWLETNWVSLREEALCPASWAQSLVDCSGEPEG